MTFETKVQIETLKTIEADGSKVVRYSDDGKFIYLTPDGFKAIKIAKSDFFLDTRKLSLSESLTGNFNSAILSDVTELEITDATQQIDKKTTAVCLKCGKFETYINNDFLKNLCRKECVLYAKSNKSPIYFVRNEEIYAVAMPIRIREK